MNTAVKYAVIGRQPVALGYTAWAEMNCSEMVKQGREALDVAKDYEKLSLIHI